MLLDAVNADIRSQLDQQADLGVQITDLNDVPEQGPSNKGLWNRITNVTAVFADIKNSTQLNTEDRTEAAYAYTYFIRAMALVLERFGARYIDIQGDGIFGLFSGRESMFHAVACAITMRTATQKIVSGYFEDDVSTSWELTAGFGIDRGTLLVRQLGLRGTKQNEVWAGKPVNIAAKLSSLAGNNQIAVPDRVFNLYSGASRLRRRALLWSCGCDGNTGRGLGLDAPEGTTAYLWTTQRNPESLGLDFETRHTLTTHWCDFHGAEFCEAVVYNH